MGQARLVAEAVCVDVREWADAQEEVIADGRITSIEKGRLRRLAGKTRTSSALSEHRQRLANLISRDVQKISHIELRFAAADLNYDASILDLPLEAA